MTDLILSLVSSASFLCCCNPYLGHRSTLIHSSEQDQLILLDSILGLDENIQQFPGDKGLAARVFNYTKSKLFLC